MFNKSSVLALLLILVFAGCVSMPETLPTCPAPSSTVSPETVFVGGLKLGDVEAKKREATRILKSPTGFEAPMSLDNSGYVTGIFNQGQLPECAAFSQVAMLSASYWRAKHVKTEFDAHKLYVEAKKIDGSPTTDGTTLEDVMIVAMNVPVSKTGEMPDIKYETIISVDDIPFAIHKYGWAWVGLRITDAWYKPDSSGRVSGGGRTIGGHAVVVVGYDHATKVIKILNSWGSAYGNKGFIYLSYEEFDREFAYGYSQDINWSK